MERASTTARTKVSQSGVFITRYSKDNQSSGRLDVPSVGSSMARKRVTVIDYPDGRLAIRYKGVDLPYRIFDKRPQVNPAAIVENKRLGPIWPTSPSSKRSSTCPVRPRRRGDVARRTTCSRSDRWTPGRRVARCGSFTRRPLDTKNSTQQRKGRLSYPQPSDISKWPKS